MSELRIHLRKFPALNVLLLVVSSALVGACGDRTVHFSGSTPPIAPPAAPPVVRTPSVPRNQAETPNTLDAKKNETAGEPMPGIDVMVTPEPLLPTVPTVSDPQPAPIAVISAAPVPPSVVTLPPAATPTVSPISNPMPMPVPVPVPMPKPADLCDLKTKGLNVLVIDLKSGWFAGDGGDFFKNFTRQECGQKVKIAYVHITQELIESNFSDFPKGHDLIPCLGGKDSIIQQTNSCRMAALDAFDQVWLLSGSQADTSDLPLADEFYLSIKSRIADLLKAKPNAGVFMGAGLGNAEHANDMAQVFFKDFSPAKAYFADNTVAARGSLPSTFYATLFASSPLAAHTATAASPLPAGSFDVSSVLFHPVFGFVDYDKEAHKDLKSKNPLGECLTDPVVLPGARVLARDRCGATALAEATLGDHKVVLEGNMARFYLTKPAEYFNRLVTYLIP